jgi:hypothetical protein
MIQIPANLAQRILEAARIAALMHHEDEQGAHPNRNAGGAGLAVVDDGLYSTDGDGASSSADLGWFGGAPRIR